MLRSWIISRIDKLEDAPFSFEAIKKKAANTRQQIAPIVTLLVLFTRFVDCRGKIASRKLEIAHKTCSEDL
jgi:hypothetical protein